MKITSQLLNAPTSVASKTNSSPDSGTGFHSAFTAAVALGNSLTTTQVKAKPQVQDAKPQESDKKKIATSGSPVSSASGPADLSRQVSQEVPAHFAVPVHPTNETAVQASGNTSNDSKSGIKDFGVGGSALSAQSSISPILQLPANPLSIGEAERNAGGHRLDIVATSEKSLELPAGNAADASRSNSNAVSHNLSAPVLAVPSPVGTAPGQTLSIPAVHVAPPTVEAPALAATVDQTSPAVNPETAKPLSTDRVVETSKPVDAPSAASAVNTVDLTVLVNQQTNAAISQSVAGSVSLPSLASTGSVQSAPAISTSNASSINKSSDAMTAAASRSAISSTKGKPASSSTDFHGKVADGTTGNSQTGSSSPAASPQAMKVAEVTGVTSQGSSQSGNALVSSTLQQIVIAGQPEGSSRLQQATQAVNVPAEPAAHNASGQLSLGDQSTQGISSAQLTQSMRSSEMKLGMQSAEFGNISISTSLNHQAISAQISIDHSELGKALAVHLPAIEEKLGSAYGVQAKVELRDTNNPSSSNDSAYSNSGQQSREQRQSQGGASTAAQSPIFERVAARSNFSTPAAVASSSRLDIRI